MKKITLTFDENIFQILQECCRRHEILDNLNRADSSLSHDSKNSELTRHLVEYLYDKIGGMMAYNYLIQYRKTKVTEGSS